MCVCVCYYRMMYTPLHSMKVLTFPDPVANISLEQMTYHDIKQG